MNMNYHDILKAQGILGQPLITEVAASRCDSWMVGVVLAVDVMSAYIAIGRHCLYTKAVTQAQL